MMPSSIQWDDREIVAGLKTYRGKVHQACLAVATYFQPILESEAKKNAPWRDRSGLARVGLNSFVEDVSVTMVELYLAHRMEYGVFLETRHSGRYSVILPTIESHYSAIFKMLQDVLK